MPPPLARTNAEAHLYMERRPCDSCGEQGFSGRSTVVMINGDMCSQYTGACGRCGEQQAFTFRLPEDVRLPLERDIVFGGPEPSELLDPGEWLAVADVASSRQATEGEDLMLAAAAVDEVLKFVPAGAEEVPPETLRTEDGREVYEREPGRFRKARLEAVAATYRRLADEMRAQNDR